MLQSKLFGKTNKKAPRDEKSVNAKLLARAGFIEKLMAGVYSYLPLGWKVLQKIENIVREEMNAIQGQEILMPALQPKKLWDETGRWESGKDVMFQFKGRSGADLGLGWTHEETLTDIIRNKINSYQDLPLYIYQIQTKFRNELRAKSGILRGREFSMKDLYSFHTNEKDFLVYYEKVKESYLKIFKKIGLDAIVVEASGGEFSKSYSHEFQVLTSAGEDTIIYCDCGKFGQNVEVAKLKAGKKCPVCGKELKSGRSIEAGNIFTLGTKYSEIMKAYFTDKDGKKKPIIMGCYGFGISRAMGAIVEIHNDKKGIIWPSSVAPFNVHLIEIGSENSDIKSQAEELYKSLQKEDIEVLYDDREESPGIKFADADLIGIPLRIIVSKRTIAKNSVELKKRNEEKTELVKVDKIINKLKNNL
jgi:prolyl-tRNA synthetase